MTTRIIYKFGQRLRDDSRLTYIEEVEPHVYPSGQSKRIARFECDCGGLISTTINAVKTGKALSCGCLHLEKVGTHGMTYNPLYKVWSEMVQRCTNPRNKRFKDYGERGINICGSWLKFQNFYSDMGERPSDNHSIDRKNNNQGYSKDNCRWSTPKEQQRNMRSNIYIASQGKTMCLSEWSEYLGINRSTLRYRLESGWSINRALSAPVRNKHAH